ncbi:hypothetical protein N2152v2_003639 [Parachlorella kessleri]
MLVQGGVRLTVAARISSPATDQAAKDKAPSSSKAAKAAEMAAAQQKPTTRKRTLPRGLPALPPRPSLSAILPSPEHSTRPVGLPLNFLAQTAARGPLYRLQGDRLLRGLIGLAATVLLCRGFPTPFTRRKAWLPPPLFEFFYHKILGPVAAVSYLYSDPTQLAATSPRDRAICQAYEPAIQQAYTAMREAGAREAARLGRSVAFAVPEEGGVQAIGASSINACCLPGGIVFVHSGLIEAVAGSKQALSFVVGHEVGHAIGRHSLEKTTMVYGGMFTIDVLMGLAQRLLQRPQASGIGSALPRGAYTGSASGLGAGLGEGDREGGALGPAARQLLRILEGTLQSGLYVMQLGQSRRHEYEADELALHLGSHAGMDRKWLAGGAQQTLQQFMRMEAAPGPALGGVSGLREQPDNPLSTHPAAVNRLRRLAAVFRGMTAAAQPAGRLS